MLSLVGVFECVYENIQYASNRDNLLKRDKDRHISVKIGKTKKLYDFNFGISNGNDLMC